MNLIDCDMVISVQYNMLWDSSNSVDMAVSINIQTCILKNIEFHIKSIMNTYKEFSLWQRIPYLGKVSV